MPRKSEKICAVTYLEPQLELLRDRQILVLGKKALKRVERYLPGFEGRIISAHAIIKPFCFRHKAKASWKEAASKVRRLSN